jgi:hypothetical protein
MIRRQAAYAGLPVNKPFSASTSQKALRDKGIRNNLD